MICIKYGPNPQGLREVHIQPQMVDRPMKKEQRNQNEDGAKEGQNDKRKDPKSHSHTTKEEQNSVETKSRSSEVHHHTTKKKQNGVETEESIGVHIYFSWT